MKRIARLSQSPYSPDVALARYDTLIPLLKQYLPASTLALFAKPKSLENGIIEWYSELGGQPQNFAVLSPTDATEVKRLLEERLASILQLARQLETRGESGQKSAALLRETSCFPDVSVVYSLNGQPVITYWGNPPPPPPPATPPPPAVEPAVVPTPITPTPQPRRPIRWKLPLTLFVIALAALLWALLCYLPHHTQNSAIQAVLKSLPDCQAVQGIKDLCDPLLHARQQCPLERPDIYIPQLAIVLDTATTNAPALPRTNTDIPSDCHNFPKGKVCKNVPMPREIAAKISADDIIRQTPADVPITLTNAGNCPTATNVGTYAPDQRDALRKALIEATPGKGTSLGTAIEASAKMLDGVRRDAHLVVITNNKNTCGPDPCAVAATLAKEKPNLKIHVIAASNTDAGRCLAEATGGQIHNINNIDDIADAAARIIKGLNGPAHCPSGTPLPPLPLDEKHISMLGIWALGIDNSFSTLKISWNATAGQFEAHIHELADQDRKKGFSKGELVWVTTPKNNAIEWPAQLKSHYSSNNRPTGQFNWNPVVFSFKESGTRLLFSHEYAFGRICEIKSDVIDTPAIPACP